MTGELMQSDVQSVQEWVKRESGVIDALLTEVRKVIVGQRYLLDFVVPGGTSAGLPADSAAMLSQAARTLDAEVRKLREIYEEHAGVRDRFLATGTVSPELAARLGLTPRD